MSTIRPAARAATVAPFHVMDVVAAATERQRTHGDAILLCVGQPGAPAPRAVRDAAHAALDAHHLGYTATQGLLELREVIATDYQQRYGVQVDPAEVFLTTGSSGGFVAVFLALLDPGDEVILPAPGYPAYRNMLRAVGATVIEPHCGPEDRYQVSERMLAELWEQGHRPRAVIVTSPNNPTGTIIDPAELEAIARWCATHDCALISDEIYHGIAFGHPTHTAWQYTRDAIVIGSVSKYHCMTGWRLGWVLLPPALRGAVDRISANMAICPPAVSQYAALAAFGDSARAELRGHVATYARNRELLLRRLPELGITTFAPPDGGFYVYFSIAHLTADSEAFCVTVLDRTGVALAPGTDFDTMHGRQWARLCFAGTTSALDEALDRLAASGLFTLQR